MTDLDATLTVQTLRWDDVSRRIEMIDQRVLPARFDMLAYESAAGVAAAIRSMVVRGAPAIGCAAAYGVALEALRLQQLSSAEFALGMNSAFELLAHSRPTAVNLFWALERMRAALAARQSQPQPLIAAALLQQAHDMLAEDIAANGALGAYGAALLPSTAQVLTHCNAGALATAGYGTALGVIRSAVAAGKRISVIADETRPFLQGARLTVWELQQENIPVTLITDNMAGHMMQQGAVDAVIVGADRIAANGDFANKIGTYMVAVLAQRPRHSVLRRRASCRPSIVGWRAARTFRSRNAMALRCAASPSSAGHRPMSRSAQPGLRRDAG